MKPLFLIASLVVAATAVPAHAEKWKSSGFIKSDEPVQTFETLSLRDPRHPDCGDLKCARILKTPFNPNHFPGPDDLAIDAQNIRVRFILDTLHHEVIAGTGAAPVAWGNDDFVRWQTDCPSPKCAGFEDGVNEYFLPSQGETFEEDIVMFEALYIADPGPDYYNARCTDFGGASLNPGTGIPFDHEVLMFYDGGFVTNQALSDGVYAPGTYGIDYEVDVTDGKNTSRYHFDGWAVVSCTADTDL